MSKNNAKIKKILYYISPKLQLSIMYRQSFGKKLDWRHPRDLNEKINWLKIYSDTSLWSRLADKYAVREYVKECGFKDNLVKLFGRWDDANDINWDDLPNEFVLKVNNGSGDILVCKDKTGLDKHDVVLRYNALLKKKFSNYNGEPHYAQMKPCIIAEELLDATKQPIETDTLIDYKIWCFNGKAYYIWACYNRHKGSVEVATYDLNWNRRDEKSIFTNHYRRAEKDLPCPQSLLEMIKMAEKLSVGIPQVRVDLYEVDNKPYFGEMTFTSAGGFNNFYTNDFLMELGSYCDLSIAPQIKR